MPRRPTPPPTTTQDTTLDFSSHDVAGLYSVAHLFPRGKPRRGLYVLTFTDGERYVGQSGNIVSRFAAHRDRWDDIDTLAFARVPRGDLDALERRLIHQHQRDATLRNITHAMGVGTRDELPDLDFTVTPDDQHSWLATGAVGRDIGGRVDDAVLRPKGRNKYRRLQQRPLGPVAIALTQLYVQSAILHPRATELTFWAASAVPSTNAATFPRLTALSVNKMETFVLGWEKDDPDEMWGFLNVSKSAMQGAYGTLDAFARPRQDWLEIDDSVPYESGGGDVLVLRIYAPGGMLELLAPEDGDVRVVDAARALNLMLMRKGPTLQWRWHCFDLADQLVEPL